MRNLWSKTLFEAKEDASRFGGTTCEQPTQHGHLRDLLAAVLTSLPDDKRGDGNVWLERNLRFGHEDARETPLLSCSCIFCENVTPCHHGNLRYPPPN